VLRILKVQLIPNDFEFLKGIPLFLAFVMFKKGLIFHAGLHVRFYFFGYGSFAHTIKSVFHQHIFHNLYAVNAFLAERTYI